jgi:hypothetical protein
MSVKTRGLYSSPNGDRWLLCYDPATDRVFVRYEPNEPSGGHASEIHIGTFLTRGPLNPEHHVLLRLIATLVLLTPGNASSNGTFFANSRLALPNSSDAFGRCSVIGVILILLSVVAAKDDRNLESQG